MMRLDAARSRDDVAFRTGFSDSHDLVQVFRGMNAVLTENHPVDFRLAALQRKGHRDIWHVDQVLSFATDECTPMVINGEDIGGNHGHPCAVRVWLPAHGLDVRDIGSLWMDTSGMRFTLLRVEAADRLLFLSDNIGPSRTVYDFADHICGTLRYVSDGCHGHSLHPEKQTGHVQLTPAIRHLQREAVCFRDGQWEEIGSFMPNCECAEIREVYEIINPATVAQALRMHRPPEGYAAPPSLAQGEAMLLHRMTYRIYADGTVLCDFDHQLMQDVHLSCYLGIMHQEQCDLFGGGLWRYIPKLRPLEDKGRWLDFSRPCLVSADTIPNHLPLTPDKWLRPDAPPDRQVDFFRRPDGSNTVGFASGFLPLYDGAPDKRRNSLTDAGVLVSSCKTYPTFAGGLANMRHPHRESTDGSMRFATLRGVAYRQYFQPRGEDASLYTIPCGDDRYVYMDFFGSAPQCLHADMPPGAQAILLEASEQCRVDASGLSAQAQSGYAVFRLHAAQRKD
ncbi:MAG: hypothetical protein ACI4MJ_08945 [Aristaeellaceae bacterium]